MRRTPLAVLEKSLTQLRLAPHDVEVSIRDNADSLLTWGLVRTRSGADNWQHEGNNLGIASRWNPHLYPAIDPALRKKLEAEGKA